MQSATFTASNRLTYPGECGEGDAFKRVVWAQFITEPRVTVCSHNVLSLSSLEAIASRLLHAMSAAGPRRFSELKEISPETLQVLNNLKFDRATPVQEATIPLFCGNKVQP